MTAHDLQLDESLLTGESVPVSRQQGEQVVSGSMVVRGGGLVEVNATGAATAIGKIGKSIQQLAPEESPLQREIALLIKRFAVGGIIFVAAVAVTVAVAVWLAARRLAWRATGGYYAGDVDIARRIFRHPDGVSCTRCAASGRECRAGAPCQRDRSAGRGHSAVCRQDRYLDAKPYDATSDRYGRQAGVR